MKNASWYIVAGLLLVALLSHVGGAPTDGGNDTGDVVVDVSGVEGATSDFYRLQAANFEAVYRGAAGRLRAPECEIADLTDFRDYVKPQLDNATNKAFAVEMAGHFGSLNGDKWDTMRAADLADAVADGYSRHK